MYSRLKWCQILVDKFNPWCKSLRLTSFRLKTGEASSLRLSTITIWHSLTTMQENSQAPPSCENITTKVILQDAD